MHILLTNDDGITAKGLSILEEVVVTVADKVTVVAPEGQRSAASHAMSINKDLYLKRIASPLHNVTKYSLEGTPVDCVKTAMEFILKKDRPDLIISGINNGYNLGSDVLYSGTVSAAMEGPYYLTPAVAVSIGKMNEGRARQTAKLVMQLIDRIIFTGKFPGILNINVPEKKGDICLENVVVAPQTVQFYKNVIVEKKDEKGDSCIRIVGDIDMSTAPAFSDIANIKAGKITVTPLRWQQTATAAMETVDRLIFHKY